MTAAIAARQSTLRNNRPTAKHASIGMPVKPRVILMDEPCSALDPIATAVIEELIDELKTNFSIVIVTHSMQQAARVSQKTAFFHMGYLVESGKTKNIFTSPKDERTQNYITGRIGQDKINGSFTYCNSF